MDFGAVYVDKTTGDIIVLSVNKNGEYIENERGVYPTIMREYLIGVMAENCELVGYV